MSDEPSALVKGLGGASLVLGVTEVMLPGKVAALAGVQDSGPVRPVIRLLGVRECGHAAALLFGPSKLVWTRVAGDALDLALLVAGLATRARGRRGRGILTAVALAGIGGADLYAALRTTGNGSSGRHGNAPRHRILRAAVTVWRSPEEVYRFWRDLENLPTFMYHLKSVTVDADDRSHWVANAPIGQSVQWDAQITEDEPNKRIVWQSLPGALVENGGSVEFAPTPDGSGTEVRVTMSYHIPGGVLGKAAATVFGESPEQQVNDDLRRFKQLLETGQVMRSDGSPEGAVAARQMHQRTAQPHGGDR
ncbi:SRPBCC family protein [Mycobacterium noviomagense]|uniref:Coenzyme Q-binding protein COQ10 START domain-containing protein n=1 Tax=Mycobacterium noviomagense TaxID=459858 RepID=A0A7I7PBT3_9MYCO|nr:SRPBCC family protein [Mycobacterium noviomagense]ORB11863.1 hypothetical protein BST37_17905 [Mycobacterium noviomagense]BBY06067.1 hypothetical protein MNVI_13850 [Mycobacterium noviomagense]